MTGQCVKPFCDEKEFKKIHFYPLFINNEFSQYHCLLSDSRKILQEKVVSPLMIKKAQSVKMTDILEKGLSEEKKDLNKQISIVNKAEKQNLDLGTLDSISCFKAFYSLGVFDKHL